MAEPPASGADVSGGSRRSMSDSILQAVKLDAGSSLAGRVSRRVRELLLLRGTPIRRRHLSRDRAGSAAAHAR